MSECSICKCEIIDKVSITCSATHSFCFKCVLDYIKQNNGLKGCPLCRGGDRFILIQQNQNHVGDDKSFTHNFFSLKYFVASLPILQKIMDKDNLSNSCIISDDVILTYISNQKQIEMTRELLKVYKLDQIFSFIKWTKKKQPISQDIGHDVLNMMFPSMQTRSVPDSSRTRLDSTRPTNGVIYTYENLSDIGIDLASMVFNSYNADNGSGLGSGSEPES